MRLTRPSTACKWLIILLTASGTSLVAFSMGYMSFRTALARKWILSAIANEKTQTWQSMALYTLFNLTLAGVAGFAVHMIAPEASGSGIPDIMAYLNGVDINAGFFGLPVFLTKVFGSVLVTGSGMVVGKEGSLLHVGSCLAHMMAQLTKRFLNKLATSSNDRKGLLLRQDLRDLVTAGAAAGVCAVFRAPVGGMLYVMELSTRWRPELTWRAFFACAVTAYTLALCTSQCIQVGNKPVPRDCSFYTSGGLGSLPKISFEDTMALYEVFGVIALGVLGGILGAMFNKINVQICKWRRSVLAVTSNGTFLEVLLISLVTSALHLFLPLFGTCLPCSRTPTSLTFEDTTTPFEWSSISPFPYLATPNSGSQLHMGVCGPGLHRFRAFTPLQCGDNEYNDLTVLLFNTANATIAALLGQSEGSTPFSVLSLSIFLVFYFTLTLWTYGAAIPSGFFTPNLMIGAVLGQAYGTILEAAGVTGTSGNMYAILGAAAFFGGTMRCTVSICVILLEMTHTGSTLPYLMLVLIIAKGTADRFNDSVFVKHALSVKKLQYIARMPHLFIRRSQLKASKIVNRDMPPLSLTSASEQVVRVLESDREWTVWPVLDDGSDTENARPHVSQLAGFVERIDLVNLLLVHVERTIQHDTEQSQSHSQRTSVDHLVHASDDAAPADTLLDLDAWNGRLGDLDFPLGSPPGLHPRCTSPDSASGRSTEPTSTMVPLLPAIQEYDQSESDYSIADDDELSDPRPQLQTVSSCQIIPSTDHTAPCTAMLTRQMSISNRREAFDGIRNNSDCLDYTVVASLLRASEAGEPLSPCVERANSQPSIPSARVGQRSFRSTSFRGFLPSTWYDPAGYENEHKAESLPASLNSSDSGGSGDDASGAQLPRVSSVEEDSDEGDDECTPQRSLTELWNDSRIAQMQTDDDGNPVPRLTELSAFYDEDDGTDAVDDVPIVRRFDDNMWSQDDSLDSTVPVPQDTVSDVKLRNSRECVRPERQLSRVRSLSFVVEDSISPRDTGEGGGYKFVHSVLPVSIENKKNIMNLKGIVRRSAITISPGMSVERVFQLFNSMAYRFLPVVDGGGHFHGVITRREIVRCQWQMSLHHETEAARHMGFLAYQAGSLDGESRRASSTICTAESDRAPEFDDRTQRSRWALW